MSDRFKLASDKYITEISRLTTPVSHKMNFNLASSVEEPTAPVFKTPPNCTVCSSFLANEMEPFNQLFP